MPVSTEIIRSVSRQQIKIRLVVDEYASDEAVIPKAGQACEFSIDGVKQGSFLMRISDIDSLECKGNIEARFNFLSRQDLVALEDNSF
jgi:hypothetical protein